METDLDRASGLTVTLIALSMKEFQQLDDVMTPDEFARVDAESTALDQKIQSAIAALTSEQRAGNPMRCLPDEVRIEMLRPMDTMLALIIDHKIADAKELSHKWMDMDWKVYDIFKQNNLKTLTTIAEATGMDLEPPPPPFGPGKINPRLKP